MEAQGNPPEKKTTALWQYVPIEDYKPPEGMVSESLRGGIAGLWRKLRTSRKAADNIFEPEKDLEALSENLLKRNVLSPDWQVAVPALQNALMPWMDASEVNPATLVIGFPHGGNPDVMKALAKEKKWTVIPPPSLEQILSEDEQWFEKFERKKKSPWVLATLERCFLRHVNGLNLVRRFFDRLLAGELGRGIIGCDSWAWAYLRRVLDLRLPVKLVAQSFDHVRLSEWFQGLCNPNKAEYTIFRQADNGSYVLAPKTPRTEAKEGQSDSSDFLKKLAVHSIGIPGIAWALWRQSLNTVPDVRVGGEKTGDESSVPQATIWVSPWEKMNLPVPPAPQERDQIIVLHTLLLHNGLALEVLLKILAIPSTAIHQTLFSLRRSGILEQTKAVWRVSALAYPAVRRLLNGEGYITDDF